MFKHVRLLDGLYLREWGDRGAPKLAWLHGLGESSYCFQRLVQRREFEDFHHLLVDLPGYGRAPWRDPWTLEQMADSLASSLEGSSILLGHSMGGVLGILLGERCPEKIRGLVNIDGNVTRGDCGYSGPVSKQSLPHFLERGYDELREQLFRDGNRGYYISMSLAQPEMVYQHSLDLLRLSESGELAKRMSRLPFPSLYVAGVPGGASADSLKLLDQARVEVCRISPSGHWPFLEQEGQFADRVSQFSTRLSTS